MFTHKKASYKNFALGPKFCWASPGCRRSILSWVCHRGWVLFMDLLPWVGFVMGLPSWMGFGCGYAAVGLFGCGFAAIGRFLS